MKLRDFQKRISGYAIHFVSFLIQMLLYEKRNRHFRKETVNNILLVKLEHIGDVILALPAMHTLREHFPGANITLLTGSWSVAIVEGSPLIDEVILYNSKRYDRESAGPNEAFKRKQVFAALRKNPPDLLVSLSNDWRTLWLACLCRFQYRADIGTMLTKRKVSRFFPGVFKRSDTLRTLQHVAEMNMEVLRSIGLKNGLVHPGLCISQNEINEARNLLHRKGIADSDCKVIIHPGAIWSGRAWDAERYARIGDYVTQSLSAKVIITGNEKEVDIARQVADGMDERAYNVTGKTTLRLLAALLKECDLFIGNDGGAMHIAAAVGTPVIALFGPQSPDRFGPLGTATKVLYTKTPCSPCRQDECTESPGRRCMDLISEEEVVAAIDEMVRDHVLSKQIQRNDKTGIS